MDDLVGGVTSEDCDGGGLDKSWRFAVCLKRRCTRGGGGGDSEESDKTGDGGATAGCGDGVG